MSTLDTNPQTDLFWEHDKLVSVQTRFVSSLRISSFPEHEQLMWRRIVASTFVAVRLTADLSQTCCEDVADGPQISALENVGLVPSEGSDFLVEPNKFNAYMKVKERRSSTGHFITARSCHGFVWICVAFSNRKPSNLNSLANEINETKRHVIRGVMRKEGSKLQNVLSVDRIGRLSTCHVHTTTTFGKMQWRDFSLLKFAHLPFLLKGDTWMDLPLILRCPPL